MRAIFPGKPQAKLQALSTVFWQGQRIVTYISGNALIVLRGPNDLVQTISHGDSDELQAVAVSEASGKIATCTHNNVFVYAPYGLDEGQLKWSLQHTLTPTSNDQNLCTLSWGQPREVLAGGSFLTLFDTDYPARQAWTKNVANPVKLAAFTPDASFIASTGWYDRLVKIWRRSFLGEDEERFDVSYLSHPSSVTSIRWHRRPNQDYHSDTVLYTTCGDSILRIWAATDHHGLQPLQLWSQLDLNSAIIPRTPCLPSERLRRYVFIMDGWEFESTVEHALKRDAGTDRESHTREHLMDVAYRNPDVCVIMDDRGNMSAWGLERVGCKARQPNDIFNIAIVEDLEIEWPAADGSEEDYACLYDFGGYEDGTINVLINCFDGRVQWLKAAVDRLFDSAPTSSRFSVEAIWTGHSDVIVNLAGNGQIVVSQSSGGDVTTWAQDANLSTVLRRMSSKNMSKVVYATCVSAGSDLVAFLHEDSVSLWDARTWKQMHSASCGHCDESSPRLLYFVQQANEEFLIIISAVESSIWHVRSRGVTQGQDSIRSVELPDDLDMKQQITAGRVAVASLGCEQPRICVMTKDGVLNIVGLDAAQAQLTQEHGCRTFFRSASALHGGSNRHVVFVREDETAFQIWNLNHLHQEFGVNFASHQTITAIAFDTTASSHSILAVALSHKVFVYTQRQSSFTPEDSHVWTPLRTVDLGEATTLPIVACRWLVGNNFLVAAGNQLFVFDDTVQLPQDVKASLHVPAGKKLEASLLHAAVALNTYLPTFGAESLRQYLLAGCAADVDKVLLTLHQKLKYWTEGEALSSLLGLEEEEDAPEANGYPTAPFVNGDSGNSLDDPQPPAHLTEEHALSLKETLDNVRLPHLSPVYQARLSIFAVTLGSLERHRKALDGPGLRYQMHLRLLHRQPSSQREQLSWRDIAWASHSNTQDVLVDLTSRLYNGRMVWEDARQCGMFVWLSDQEALRTHFETLARTIYTSTTPGNPINCTLHYLALRKKPVLTSLWRLATWNREQRATLKMLSNDFTDPRWRTAAKKNAYALLGLRRFEYAAAFFLLADAPGDALSVLASGSQVGDLQLAIAVGRVYCGDQSEEFRCLLRKHVLPAAARKGDRWTASWAFWMLGDKVSQHLALEALLVPLETLVHIEGEVEEGAKSWRNDEPCLIWYYEMLREKIRRKPGEKVSLLSMRQERDLVMRCAMMYSRAGLDRLALRLLKEWKYSEPLRWPQRGEVAAEGVKEFDEGIKGTKIGAPSDSGDEESAEEDEKASEEAEEQKLQETPEPPTAAASQQRKKVTEEPSAASILDNFNF